ncbi:hypothetical protein HA402_005454 [Bradysia odoriphaga]|nr:hypothetical protein HA402_005454 [Bradysia odoriphaga]
MKFFELIFVIELVHLFDVFEASLHTWGQRGYYDRNKLVETKLIEYNSTTPKNYTIIYRYYQHYMKPVSHIEINVNNTESNGYINRTTSGQYYYGTLRDIYLFTAQIHINNTKNVLATVTIYETNYLEFTYVLKGGPENNKSFTFLYMTDAFPSPQPYVQTSIGKRQTGDDLLHFESRTVTNYNRFPSRVFSYGGAVGEYLTYVRFSLNSPTAMVLVNTSYVGEREFNAIAYDMNSDRFVANFSVFGIKSTSRPNGYLGIVEVLT